MPHGFALPGNSGSPLEEKTPSCLPMQTHGCRGRQTKEASALGRKLHAAQTTESADGPSGQFATVTSSEPAATGRLRCSGRGRSRVAARNRRVQRSLAQPSRCCSPTRCTVFGRLRPLAATSGRPVARVLAPRAQTPRLTRGKSKSNPPPLCTTGALFALPSYL